MTVWRRRRVFCGGLGYRRHGGGRRRSGRVRRIVLWGYIDVLDDYGVLGGMVDPFAVFGDVGVGVNGFDQGGSGDSYKFGAFDNWFERCADGFSAASKNSGGMNMAVDGGVVGDFVVLGDAVRAAPAEEFLFDFFAVGMAADIAATCVRAHFGADSGRGWTAGRGLLRVIRLIWRPDGFGAFGPASTVNFNSLRA